MKIKLERDAVKDKDGKDIIENSVILLKNEAIVINDYFQFLYEIQYSDEHSGLNSMSSKYFKLLGQNTDKLRKELKEKGICISNNDDYCGY